MFLGHCEYFPYQLYPAFSIRFFKTILPFLDQYENYTNVFGNGLKIGMHININNDVFLKTIDASTEAIKKNI